MHLSGRMGSAGYGAELHGDNLHPCPQPRLLHGEETVTGQKTALSSTSENIISKKGHTPWWHRVILGSVYHGKLEALPQRSKKEHRFLLLINFMVDLTVLK